MSDIRLLKEKVARGSSYFPRSLVVELLDNLASRDELIKRLVEDGERFEKRSIAYVYPDETPPYYECQLCFHDADEPDNILHDKSCPITLHRALMKELEG